MAAQADQPGRAAAPAGRRTRSAPPCRPRRAAAPAAGSTRLSTATTISSATSRSRPERRGHHAGLVGGQAAHRQRRVTVRAVRSLSTSSLRTTSGRPSWHRRTAAPAGVAVLSCVVVSRLLFLADHDLWPPVTGSAQRAYHLASGLADRHDVTLLIMHWWNTDLTSFPGADGSPPSTPCRTVVPGAWRPGRTGTGEAPAVHHGSPDVVHRTSRRRWDRCWRPWQPTRSTGPGSPSHFAEQVLTATSARWSSTSPTSRPSWRAAKGGVAGTLAPCPRSVGGPPGRLLGRRWPGGWPPERVQGRRRRALRAGRDVHVVPNGVDAAPVAPPGAERSDEVLFVGTLHYGPNVDAAVRSTTAVLPLIHRSPVDPAPPRRIMPRTGPPRPR